MLAELLPPSRRTIVFSWYNLAGYGATALGAAEAGLLADHLRSRWGYSFASACRAVFLQSAGVALSLAAAVLWWACAAPRPTSVRGGAEQREPLLAGRSERLEEEAAVQPASARPPAGGAGVLSRRSRRVVVQLSTLFSVDAFAGSLVTGACGPERVADTRGRPAGACPALAGQLRASRVPGVAGTHAARACPKRLQAPFWPTTSGPHTMSRRHSWAPCCLGATSSLASPPLSPGEGEASAPSCEPYSADIPACAWHTAARRRGPGHTLQAHRSDNRPRADHGLHARAIQCTHHAYPNHAERLDSSECAFCQVSVW